VEIVRANLSSLSPSLRISRHRTQQKNLTQQKILTQETRTMSDLVTVNSSMNVDDALRIIAVFRVYEAHPEWPLSLTSEETAQSPYTSRMQAPMHSPSPGPTTSLHACLMQWSPTHQAPSGTLADVLVQALTPNNCVSLMAVVHPVLDRLYPNWSTQSGILSQVRGRVKANMNAQGKTREWNGRMERVVCMRQASRYKLTDRQAAVCRAKNEHQTRVEYASIKRAFHVLNADKDNAFAQVLLINLCSGTRAIECIRRSQFLKRSDERVIHIVGTAKAKGERERTRPLLFLTATEFLDRVSCVRRYAIQRGWSNLSNAKLGQRFNRRTNRYARALFPETQLTSHRLREVFAHLTHCLQSDMSHSAWIAHILCHASLSSVPNYTGIRVTNVNVADLHAPAQPDAAATDENRGGESERPESIVDALATMRLETQGAQQHQEAQPSDEQKRGKRKHVPDATSVVLTCGDGKRRRVLKNPKLRDHKTLSRCVDVKAELVALGIPPAYSTLRTLGYSDRIIQQATNESKE
jgi:integrase